MSDSHDRQRELAAALISLRREARVKVVEAMRPWTEAAAAASNLERELWRLDLPDDHFAFECLHALRGYVTEWRTLDQRTIMAIYDEAVRPLEDRHLELSEANRALARLNPALIELRESVERIERKERERRGLPTDLPRP